MRATTLLQTILGLKDTRVLSVSVEAEGIVVDVSPRWRTARCSGCGRRTRSCYDHRVSAWRHLDLAGMKVWLCYDQRRVDCKRCGVLVEQVPWAPVKSWFTYDFEDMVG